MSDYTLYSLGHREFEHIIQALALNAISDEVQPFGDGPDGAREATCTGPMKYSAGMESWNGYLVIQCKCCIRPKNDLKKDGDWALRELKKDLEKYQDSKRCIKIPEYFIYVTNLVLTPKNATGSKDRVREALTQFKIKFKLKSFDLWDYDKICRLLDCNESVRNAYGHFLTPGDFIAKHVKSDEELSEKIEKLIQRQGPQNQYKNQKQIDELLDDKIRQMVRWANGNGRFPLIPDSLQRTYKLVQYLNSQRQLKFPIQTEFDGTISAAMFLFNSEKSEDKKTACELIERAEKILPLTFDKVHSKENLSRAKAQLMMSEGKKKQAIKLLSESRDPKSQNIWLLFLIATHDYKTAVKFVLTHNIQIAWIDEALAALIFSDRIPEAEKLFDKTLLDFKEKEKIGQLGASPYQTRYFHEQICFSMANSLYRYALGFYKATDDRRLYPGMLNENELNICRNALKYIDELFGRVNRNESSVSYFVAQATEIEMMIQFCLRNFKASDRNAEILLSQQPLNKQVVSYIFFTHGQSKQWDLNGIVDRLKQDYPNAFWAHLEAAAILGFLLNNYELAWQHTQQALDLAKDISDRIQVVETCFNLGQVSNRSDDALQIIKKYLPVNNVQRQAIEAYQWNLKDNRKKTEEILNRLERRKLPIIVDARSKFLRGEMAIKDEKWEKARKHLEDSSKLARHPRTLTRLLMVLTKLQDTSDSYSIACQLDEISIGDDVHVLEVKAQCAMILGQYNIAEETWQRLVKALPEKPEYILGLARTQIDRGKTNDAFENLQGFIETNRCNDRCLYLSVEILQNNEQFDQAFELLEKHNPTFYENPALLFTHWELAKRTNHEEEAHRSFMQLQSLMQQGKIPPNALRVVSLEEIKSLFTEANEARNKNNNLYQFGHVSRTLICDRKNRPFYLDWAVRTQKVCGKIQPNQRTDLTTYSTNSLRIEIINTKNQLEPISIPDDLKEIVIDLHALITLHRLEILKLLSKRFTKIYYPQIINDLLQKDKRKFHVPQKNREIVFRSLEQQLHKNQITELIAPPQNINDHKSETLITRDLRLARSEEIALLAAYVETTDLTEFSDIKILRISQVAFWLYEKGLIKDLAYQGMQNLFKGEHNPISNDSVAFLKKSNRLLIDFATLEQIESCCLLQIIMESGIQVFVEKATANSIRNAVNEIDFGLKALSWHKDLIIQLKKQNIFQSFPDQTIQGQLHNIQSPYFASTFACLNFTEEKGLYLLTDDRFSQMVRGKKMINRQFGTDVLLQDFYLKKLISIEDYSKYFLQLCQWRYRFLVPDPKILICLAKSNTPNPYSQIRPIVEYSRECMEDPGLFCGFEQTDPPTSMSISYHSKWMENWIEFLSAVWLDSTFTKEQREVITDAVFTLALPDIPKGMNPDLKKRMAIIDEIFFLPRLLLFAAEASNPIALHFLLKYTFDFFEIHEEDRLYVILDFLTKICNQNDFKPANKLIAIKVVCAFYGTEFNKAQIDIILVPTLKQIGIEFRDERASLNENEEDVLGPFGLQEASEFKDENEQLLIIVKKQEGNCNAIYSLHDSLLAPSVSERKSVINFILSNTNVTFWTKALIREFKNNLYSQDPQMWHPSAKNASNVLKKDYRYALALFKKTLGIGKFNDAMARVVNDAFEFAITPSFESIIDAIPQTLKDEPNLDKLILSAAGTIRKQKGTQNTVEALLDWYLENVYFIPIISKWSIEDFLHGAYSAIHSTNTPIEEIVKIAQTWAQENEDQFAQLLYLEIVFSQSSIKSIRNQDSPNLQYAYLVIQKLLKLELLPKGIESLNASEVEQTIWAMRVQYAIYFLQYVDRNLKWELDDAIKIKIAWWMSRELVNIFKETSKLLEPLKRAKWLQEHIERFIKEKQFFSEFRHLFHDIPNTYLPGRFHTLQGMDSISIATASVLKRKLATVEDCNGMMLPGLSMVFDGMKSELIDLLIRKAFVHAGFGFGQILLPNDEMLTTHWDSPLCFSIHCLIDRYIQNTGNKLTQVQVTYLEFAKYALTIEFLENGLTKLRQQVNDKSVGEVMIILMALKAYVLSHGNLPPKASVFENDKNLITDLSKINNNEANKCINIFGTVLMGLQRMQVNDWVLIMAKQLTQTEFKIQDEKLLTIIVLNLLQMILIGGDYSLLDSMFQAKHKSPALRKILNGVKPNLIRLIRMVPPHFKENVRRLLNDLWDV